MRNWVSKAALTVALGVTAAAIPAFGQDNPESLLPPGFGTPAPQRPAAPAPVQTPRQPQPQAPAAASGSTAPAQPQGLAGPMPSVPGAPAEPAEYKLPPPVSRPINTVGAIWPGTTGFPEQAFAGAGGRYLVTLMQRIDTPLASRWAAIVLRRALLSRVPTAAGIRPADWVAERALLLTRLGDVEGARMLVQAVPIDRYTPRLYAVAAQVALASGDIGGLCPIADVGEGLTNEAVWPLARAMCAGLWGDNSLSAALIDRARQRRTLGNLDMLLVERIAASGSGSQRNANIDWSEARRLTVFRAGLAMAAGLDIPPRLLRTAGPQVMAWQGRAPALSIQQRITGARVGAALGVISSADLVNLYSALADETDSFDIANTPAGNLRKAYVDESGDNRLSAMDALWQGDIRTRDGYAGRILTARAAAEIAPDKALIAHAAKLIASMLSAGLDTQAAAWWPVLNAADESDANEGWALLAVGSPNGVPVSAGRIRNWAKADESLRNRHRAALFVAALAGLGRINSSDASALAADYGVDLGGSSRYLARLDAAAAAGRSGEVALLAALGLQTPHWAGVPPQYLYHIIAALKRVGREPEARMIAAEAVMRS